MLNEQWPKPWDYHEPVKRITINKSGLHGISQSLQMAMTLETRGPPSNPSVSNAKESTIFVGEFCGCYRNEGDFEGNIHLTGNHLSQRMPRIIYHQHTAHDYLTVGWSVRYNIPKKFNSISGLFFLVAILQIPILSFFQRMATTL